MLLRFTKMHGLGNDFALLDLISQNFRLHDSQIRQLADRRKGIGFDQLLTIEPPLSPTADFQYRIYNADGSEVDQCGNGARCLMRFVRDQGLTTKTRIVLETNSGFVECRLLKNGNITVSLGHPKFEPEQIPFIADQTEISYKLMVPLAEDHSLTTQESDSISTAKWCGSNLLLDITVVNVGNPHAVINVENVKQAPVNILGRKIESHQRFPKRVNVNFMQIISPDEIALRVFERGVGETRACGSGACASVVAGRLQGLLEENVRVHLPGGTLLIEWAGIDSSINMTGPASRVYDGRLHV